MTNLTIVFLLVAGMAASLPQQILNGGVTGQIRSDSSVLSGIRVSAIEADDPEAVIAGTAAIVSLTQTDAAGRYQLVNVPPGRYYIMAGFLDSPTYYPGTPSLAEATPVTVTAARQVEAMDFTLRRSIGTRVRGTVTRDPRAVVYSEQLSVQLSGGAIRGAPMSTPVAADGTFEFVRVPPGTYRARVYPGSADLSQTIRISDSDIDDLRLTVPFTVSVKARLLVDGPIPRISLAFKDTSARIITPSLSPSLAGTALPGSEEFSIPLPEGEYDVTLTVPEGYELKSIVQGALNLQNTALLVTAGSAPEINITLASKTPVPWVKVSGRLTGALPTVPSRVLLGGLSAGRTLEAPVQPDGTFEISRVLPGDYRVGLQPNIPALTSIGTLRVRNSDVTGVEFPLPRTRTLSGGVSGDNGSPAQRFILQMMRISDVNAMAFTIRPSFDAEGKFSVVVPEGEYNITVQDLQAGYRVKGMTYGEADVLKDRRLRVAVADSQELVVTTDFTSPDPWRRVAGRVSRPINANIMLSPLQAAIRGPIPEVKVGPDGTFEFPRVAPGRYSLRVTIPLAIAPTQTITVEDKDVLDLEIFAPLERTISGHAEIEGTAPMPRINLSFVGPTGMGGFTVRGNPRADGNFQSTVPEGEYRFRTADLPANYRIQSLTYGSVDLLKEPFKIAGGDTQTLQVRFATASPVSRVRVSGRVLGVTNLGSSGRVVLSDANLNQSLQADLPPDGSFSFSDVASGNYTVQALPHFREATTSIRVATAGSNFASPRINQIPSSNLLNIAVADKDIVGIQLTVPVTQQIQVRLAYEGQPQTAPSVSLSFTNTAETLTMSVRPSARPTEALRLPEGEYTVKAEVVTGDYSVTSIRHGTVDLMKETLRISGPSTAELQVTLAPKSR